MARLRAYPVTLVRHFVTEEAGEVELTFGFSDELRLAVDGETVIEGLWPFAGFGDRRERGYVEVGAENVCHRVAAGLHKLVVTLRVTESFGWGLILCLCGARASWLPPEAA